MKTQDEIVYNIYGEPSGTKHTCDCGFTSISFQNMNMIWNEHLAHCDVVNPPKPKIVGKKQTHSPIVRDLPLSDINDGWDL